MDNDKKIIKSPYYSIDRIGAKSDLATRGLHELGLLKDEKHFTIIYVCQFCGRLINYSSTPCIFCCDYPKTKREVIIAQALSNNSLEIGHLLTLSKAVKNKEDLELIISNLRELIDEILDIAIGAFLLFDFLPWLAALVGATHLVIVLTVSGITDITVRDIGLLVAALALMIDSLPQEVLNKIRLQKL